MADIEGKIDDMSGMLHELRPVVLDIREGQKAMDVRMRAAEIQGAEHKVKIEGIHSDLGALGDKLRATAAAARAATAAATATVAAAATPPRSEPGEWTSFVEFISAIPSIWHVGLAALAGFAAAFSFLVKHKP